MVVEGRKGDAVRLPYRKFLVLLRNEMQQSVQELENLEWHHCEEGSVEWRHYKRCVELESHASQRIEFYDFHKKKGYFG